MTDNENLFASRGILYPQAGRSPSYSHHGIFAHLSNLSTTRRYGEPGTTWDSLLTTLDTEIEQKQPTTVIMSSEILGQGVDMKALKRLRDRFTAIAVILYLRRQDDYLASVYTQMVKSGGEYRHFAFASMPDADFLTICNSWAAFVGTGALYVRRYGKAYLEGGNLLSDFLKCAVGMDLTEDMIIDQRNHNPRLTNDALEFKRLVNLCCPLSISSHFISPLLSVSYEQDQSTDADFSNNSLLQPSARERIMARYQETNAAVGRKFLGIEDSSLFGLDAKGYAAVCPEYQGLTNARAMLITSRLIDHFSDGALMSRALSPRVSVAILKALDLCLNILPDLKSENRRNRDDGVRLRFSDRFILRGLAIKSHVSQMLPETN
ncbi:hypothetical protein [Mesorhizobium sp.]|uniref:hypothetical protein n=1 Tax=Mesorhizobium sp. TaxID=1871066 RepID=UPI0025D57430|nr:hypothetical protein [Mesorhizobium sp.]